MPDRGVGLLQDDHRQGRGEGDGAGLVPERGVQGPDEEDFQGGAGGEGGSEGGDEPPVVQERKIQVQQLSCLMELLCFLPIFF